MKRYLILLLVFILFFLTGCKESLVVANVTKADFLPVFKEYVYLNGFQFLYQNDQTGAYRIYMGALYVPEKTTTTAIKTATLISGNATNEIITKYEKHVYDTVKQTAQYIDQCLMIRISMANDNIYIGVDSDNGRYGQSVSGQAKKLKNYLEDLGYNVELI